MKSIIYQSILNNNNVLNFLIKNIASYKKMFPNDDDEKFPLPPLNLRPRVGRDDIDDPVTPVAVAPVAPVAVDAMVPVVRPVRRPNDGYVLPGDAPLGNEGILQGLAAARPRPDGYALPGDAPRGNEGILQGLAAARARALVDAEIDAAIRGDDLNGDARDVWRARMGAWNVPAMQAAMVGDLDEAAQEELLNRRLAWGGPAQAVPDAWPALRLEPELPLGAAAWPAAWGADADVPELPLGAAAWPAAWGANADVPELPLGAAAWPAAWGAVDNAAADGAAWGAQAVFDDGAAPAFAGAAQPFNLQGGPATPLPEIDRESALAIFVSLQSEPVEFTVNTRIAQSAHTWFEFSRALQTCASVDNIHTVLNTILDRTVLEDVLKSIPVKGDILNRFRIFMYHMYFYYVQHPEPVMTPERIWGLIEWLTTQRMIYLSNQYGLSENQVIQVDKTIGLLEALPFQFRGRVAKECLESILSSYQDTIPDVLITLENWIPFYNAACSTGSIDYLIIKCANVLQEEFGLPYQCSNTNAQLLYDSWLVEFVNSLSDFAPNPSDDPNPDTPINKRNRLIWGDNGVAVSPESRQARDELFESFWQLKLAPLPALIQSELNVIRDIAFKQRENILENQPVEQNKLGAQLLYLYEGKKSKKSKKSKKLMLRKKQSTQKAKKAKKQSTKKAKKLNKSKKAKKLTSRRKSKLKK